MIPPVNQSTYNIAENKTTAHKRLIPAIEYEHISETIGAKEASQWERVRAQLKTKLGIDAYESWFGRCRLESVSKSEIMVSVPTLFLRNWIKSHYDELIIKLWRQQIKSILRVDILVRSAANVSDSAKEDSEINIESPVARRKKSQALEILPLAPIGFAKTEKLEINKEKTIKSSKFTGSPLDLNYKFSNLIEGKSNQMALAAAREVVEADGSVPRFNPLVIYSNVGLGKTHLLQSIAWAAQARKPNMKVAYLTAEYFMWQFSSAIKDNSALNLKESMRDIDLLLIDDMQFLQGKTMQQEFCHLLNSLIDNAKQVVVAADQAPTQLKSLEQRVKSRLQGGVAIEIRKPCLDMRRKIIDLRYIQAQLQEPNLNIDSDILEYVAQKITVSCRDIEGALNQMLIHQQFSDGKLEFEDAKRIVNDFLEPKENKRVQIEDIQKIVAKYYCVPKIDMLSKRQSKAVVFPRQVCMYLAKTLTTRSMPEIGRKFSGRDHSTVIYAIKRIEKSIKEDAKIKNEIEMIKRIIYE